MLRRCFTGCYASRAYSLTIVRRAEQRISRSRQVRYLSSSCPALDSATPLRKQLKDAAKASRGKINVEKAKAEEARQLRLSQWELTIGIEIHAQLNTSSKLFSRASAEYTDVPNAAVWPFDMALPGTHPEFQPEVLVPAIRAALSLNCEIQPRCSFDRKHYFYHDQPAGYQVTQYYEPLARNGHVVLQAHDGLSKEDGSDLRVRIQQIQLEQDTAKTQEQDDGTNLIDFNRSGHPLIEIISLPDMHSPEAAGAYVRKVQSILYAVDAATTGMELGGLRADVNVSIRRAGATYAQTDNPFQGLGQRTEIKNLSSFKSVEDAVRAERDRQIDLLEAGGVVEAETRGWSLSHPTVTRRLRGKEGEVDYRYMPDPDIAPVHIDPELVGYLYSTLPPLPHELRAMLCRTYNLTTEDANALLSIDDGMRLLWYQDIVARVSHRKKTPVSQHGVMVGNWVLHELGTLLTTNEMQWHSNLISPIQMTDLIYLLEDGSITGSSARRLLRLLFDGDERPVQEIVEAEGLLFSEMTQDEYNTLAQDVLSSYPVDVQIVRAGGRNASGKQRFLEGMMMKRADRSRIDARKAQAILQELLSS